jgi:hypothetical protein
MVVAFARISLYSFLLRFIKIERASGIEMAIKLFGKVNAFLTNPNS